MLSKALLVVLVQHCDRCGLKSWCVCVWGGGVLERMLRQAVRRMSGDVGNAQTALVVNV